MSKKRSEVVSRILKGYRLTTLSTRTSNISQLTPINKTKAKILKTESNDKIEAFGEVNK